jgi:hypothetical protein
MEEEVAERILKFLKGGKTELNRTLRYEVLSIFSSGREYSTRDIHRILLSKGINVSYWSLCSSSVTFPSTSASSPSAYPIKNP